MSESTDEKSIEILLVEDNPGDVELTKEAFKEWKMVNSISVVSDGEEALDYLYKRGQYSKVGRPDLILLDLNLPKKTGVEVLEDIKNHPDLKRIPVIVLTSSKAEQDIMRTYNLHANCYINKPIDLDEFIALVKSMKDFWFRIVKYPPR